MKFYYKNIFNLLLMAMLLILSACTKHQITHRLLHKLEYDIYQKHHITHGSLFLIYDLTNANNKNLYFNNLNKALNNLNIADDFLLHIAISGIENFAIINKRTYDAIKKSADFLIKIDKKYPFLSSGERLAINTTSLDKKTYCNLSQKIINDNTRLDVASLQQLANIDVILRKIPIILITKEVKITSRYGMRKNLSKKTKLVNGKNMTNKFHYGIDIQYPTSSPIFASASGIVTKLSHHKNNSYGNYIEIKHSKHFSTKYAHLAKTYVKEGDVVIKGQKIGTQGKTGNALSEHLHLEVIFGNKAVDPMDFVIKN